MTDQPRSPEPQKMPSEREVPAVRSKEGSLNAGGPKTSRSKFPALPGSPTTTSRRVRTVRRKASPAAVVGSLLVLLLVAGAGAGAVFWITRSTAKPVTTGGGGDSHQDDKLPVVPAASEADVLIGQAKVRLQEIAKLQAEKSEQWPRIASAAKDAADLLTKAISAAPQSAAAHFYRASARLHLADHAGAVEDASRAVQLEPGTGMYHLRRGIARLERHLHEHRLARLCGDPPPPAEVRGDIAADFRKAGQNAGTTLDPDYCDAAALTLEGKFSTAMALADRITRRGGAGEEWYRLQGIAAELEGKEALAAVEFDKCLERRPGQATLYLARALARRSNFEYEGAERDATAYLRVAAEPVPVQIFRAEIRAIRRDYRGALDDCRAVLDRDGGNRRARLAQARCRIAIKDFAPAQDAIRAVLAADPSNVEALLLLSEIHLWMGQLAEGEKLIEQALAANPNSVSAYVARCDLRRIKEEYDRALEDAEKAIALAPKDARAYAARGDVYRAKGEHDKALNDYRTAKTINVYESRAHVGLAYSLEATGEPMTALEAVRHAARTDPRNPDLLILRSNLLRNIGEMDAAFRDIDQALQMDPNNPEAYIARAMLWLRTDNVKKMLDDFKKAEELRPLAKATIEKIIRDNKPKPPPPKEEPKPEPKPEPDEPKEEPPKPETPPKDEPAKPETPPKDEPPKPEPPPEGETPKPAKPFNPWAGVKPGSWFRLKASGFGPADTYTDIGLKELGDSYFVRWTQEQGKPEQEQRVDLGGRRLSGQETLAIDGKEWTCDVWEMKDGKMWTANEGAYAGRLVLKAKIGGVQPRSSVATKIVGDTLKVGAKEYDVMVVENDVEFGPQLKGTQKAWVSKETGLEFIRMEMTIGLNSATIELVEQGDDWSKRPAFPAK